MGFLRFLPAAELLIHGDQFQLRKAGKILSVGKLRQKRAVVVLCHQFLCVGCIQKLQVGLGHGLVAMLFGIAIHHGHRRFRLDGNGWHHDFELVRPQFIDGKKRLVFPSQQDITNTALYEGIGRSPGTGIQHRHIAVDFADEVPCRFITAVFVLRERIGSQVVPACAAGGFWVGGNYLYTVAYQVIPIEDLLRVALAHQQHNR